ncbi:MAG: FKBP-type peptidyl-prolyl cis-trans isomerase, partial [Chloroflexi bacterium]|nr:FKBP-type peptidyl-prolyl cis-trans isomerase [Chloroflexota bacterium]
GHYTGTLDNGDVFDTSRDGDPPLEFVLGGGQMIPGFEKAVRGMAIGEIKTVHLSPNDAYGEHDDDLILEMPLEGAPVGLHVKLADFWARHSAA